MYIKSIKLESIKGFSSIDFDFQRPSEGGYAGLNVIVGGNSSGKSTILKALALALAGPSEGRQLMKTTAGWIANGAKQAVAEVEIKVDESDQFRNGKRFNDTFPCGIRWTQDSQAQIAEFKSLEFRKHSGSRVPAARGPWDPNAEGWFCCGYGPMRRLTGSSPDAMRDAVGDGKVASFVSLFREDVALSESEEWLKRLQFKVLEDKSAAEATFLSSIKDFLNEGLLPRGFRIERITSDHVFVKSGEGIELPMRDLSDGCRSAYALILDVIHQIVNTYGVGSIFSENIKGYLFVNKPGVILIDELEAHLHPGWQIRITEWLKTRFPLMQFFVTSHSPLIVQAADRGGIFVLPLQGESRSPRRLNDNEYERLVLGRAEKVLLGEAFGLKSTRGAWANAQIARFKLLDAKKNAKQLKESAEKEEYTELVKQMKMVFDEPEGRKAV